jgi:hypothetical protein
VNFKDLSGPTNIYHSFMMLKEIGMRGRFNYSVRDIFGYFGSCLCIKRFNSWKNIKAYRKHLIFKRGKDKIKAELDVMNMIKASSFIKLMSHILLTQKQKLLL